ncbi:MAG: precorrin-2 C(20)-methyltransferase [Bacteroides sp.]
MSTKDSVCFVSLGPGDPELLTMKGLKALEAADLLFCPATADRSRGRVSRAADIVAALCRPGLTARLRLFGLPMSKDRRMAEAAYDGLCQEILAQRALGKQVAVVAEGDAGFYSSIQYVYDKLQAEGVAVERIAGVPAFIAAAAVEGLAVAGQEERLLVVPGLITAEELVAHHQQGTVVVIMKLSQCAAEVRRCLRLHPEYAYHYFEQVGTAAEYVAHDAALLLERQFPYFSLLIVAAGSQTDSSTKGESVSTVEACPY